MDEQFQNVSHSIIDKFLDKVSESCHMKKDDLWSLWREMFSFPVPKALKKSKPKAETKKTDTKVEPLEEKKTESKEKSPHKASESAIVNESKEKSPQKVSESVTVSEAKEKSPPKEPAPHTEQDKKDKSPKKKRDTCQFKITRGERAGQECGKNVAKTSEQFCTYHCK